MATGPEKGTAGDDLVEEISWHIKRHHIGIPVDRTVSVSKWARCVSVIIATESGAIFFDDMAKSVGVVTCVLEDSELVGGTGAGLCRNGNSGKGEKSDASLDHGAREAQGECEFR